MNQETMNMTDAISDYESVKGRLLMQAVGTEENKTILLIIMTNRFLREESN